MPVLETERLLLRPFREDDLDAYAEMMADPEVTRFLGGPLDRDDAWRNMALVLGHETLRGWSQSAAVEKATRRLVGRVGLWQPEGWPGLEVGWCLARWAWGQGYATEAAVAWRDWAAANLAAPELLSVVHPDNTPSIRVAERIGHAKLRAQTVRGTWCLVYGQPLKPR